ncbi:phosphoribosylanthranilate isomerase [Allohahella marinimesophila]|uniref:phosphoribosylanthranilate isomerase n=1 Tax=Allohahella marinimesophila TaxID=1054972 RepID=UPI0031D4A15F
MRVKICGIREAEHAHAAAHAGADALGFVFYAPSVRAITPRRCADICRDLPPFVTRVALFVNPEADEVRQVIDEAGCQTLQFHGTEAPEFCAQFGLPWVKAIGMTDDIDLAAESLRYKAAQALLLDSYDPIHHGGTGRTFDWTLAHNGLRKPLILAGGLTASNVGDAIRTVQPYAVDISGGVEIEKGVKSTQKIQQFLHEVMATYAIR